MSETETVHYCFYHPNTATGLRCNKCGKYICVRDAILTPVGYRCKDCVHAQQDVFYNSLPVDYVIAAVITLPIAYIGALIVPRLFWFAIFLGPAVGGLIAEAIRRATQKRRGRYTWAVAVGCLVLATLIALLPSINALTSVRSSFEIDTAVSPALNLVIAGIYLVLCGGTIIARLRFGK